MPPLFNLGVLFGVRERGEPSWRYEAPSPRPQSLGTRMLIWCMEVAKEMTDMYSL
jgi:hypothetical protein